MDYVFYNIKIYFKIVFSPIYKSAKYTNDKVKVVNAFGNKSNLDASSLAPSTSKLLKLFLYNIFLYWLNTIYEKKLLKYLNQKSRYIGLIHFYITC